MTAVVLSDGSDVLIRRVPADERGAASLAAVCPADGRTVGLARFRRLPTDRQSAEVAVCVVDDWQRRGLGRALVIALAAQARDERIRKFTALVPVDDHATLCLLRAVNAEVSVVLRKSGTVRYEVALARWFCDLCGKQTEPDDGERLTGRRPQRVCDVCLRRYVPKIQARLADPWWI